MCKNLTCVSQQYLTTRIMLSKSQERLYKRRSGVKSPSTQREPWTCPPSAKNDAIKIASSLRNYGQKHRFREAPLSFVNHIAAAADIVISATESATNEDDRNAYLHISSFLSGVLKYMAEVHIKAGTLVEAVQQRMNSVIQKGLARSNSARDASSTYSAGHDSHLWQWTRYDMADELGIAPRPLEPERPRSVVGILNTAQTSSASHLSPPSQQHYRPNMVRQTSTPAKLPVHPEASMEDLNAATPSFKSIKDSSSTVGLESQLEDNTSSHNRGIAF